MNNSKYINILILSLVFLCQDITPKISNNFLAPKSQIYFFDVENKIKKIIAKHFPEANVSLLKIFPGRKYYSDFPAALIEIDKKQYAIKSVTENELRAKAIHETHVVLSKAILPFKIPTLYKDNLFKTSKGQYFIIEEALQDDTFLKYELKKKHFKQIGIAAGLIHNALTEHKFSNIYTWLEKEKLMPTENELEEITDDLNNQDLRLNSVIQFMKEQRNIFLNNFSQDVKDRLIKSNIHNDLLVKSTQSQGNIFFDDKDNISTVFDFDSSRHDYRIVEFMNMFSGNVSYSHPYLTMQEQLTYLIQGYQSSVKKPLSLTEVKAIIEIIRNRFLEEIYKNHLAKKGIKTLLTNKNDYFECMKRFKFYYSLLKDLSDNESIERFAYNAMQIPKSKRDNNIQTNFNNAKRTQPIIILSAGSDTSNIVQKLSKKHPDRIKAAPWNTVETLRHDNSDILIFKAKSLTELIQKANKLQLLGFATPKVIGVDLAPKKKLNMIDLYIKSKNKSNTADPVKRLENYLYKNSLLYPPTIDYYNAHNIDLDVVYNEKYSGRMAWDRGKGTWILDGKDTDRNLIKTKIPAAELLYNPIAEEKTFSAYSYGNLYHNEWFMIYDGKTNSVIHRAGEPFLRRTYTMMVLWKNGRISSENVRFGKTNTGQTTVMIGSSKKDHSSEIKTAFFGQRLIHKGKKVPLEKIYQQFDDMYHLYHFPQFVDYKEDGTPIYGASLGEKELFGKLSMDTDDADFQRDALHKVIKKNGLLTLDLKKYFKENLSDAAAIEDIKRNALENRGYIEKTNGVLYEGEYRITDNQLEVKLIKSKYPHNLIGISKTGKLVCINLVGDKATDLGYTISQVQNKIISETKEDPIKEIFLLANSKDVFKYTNNGLQLKQSAKDPYTNLSAMIVVSDKNKSMHNSTKNILKTVQSAA